jgi:hypothetical protein
MNPTGLSQVLDELVNGSVTKTYTYGLQRISENQLVGSTGTTSGCAYRCKGRGGVSWPCAGSASGILSLPRSGWAGCGAVSGRVKISPPAAAGVEG